MKGYGGINILLDFFLKHGNSFMPWLLYTQVLSVEQEDGEALEPVRSIWKREKIPCPFGTQTTVLISK